MADSVLDIADLSIALPDGQGGMNDVVRRVSFTVGQEILALVGESGSGKSLTGRAIIGLLPPAARPRAARLVFEGRDLLSLSPRDWRRLRGNGLGLILQDPKYSLNPALKVGVQVEESLILHSRLTATARRRRALDMLERVGLSDPERVYHSYPAALSGGMGQRVMIAAMLINPPRLLIADEATSALDHELQHHILTLLKGLTAELGMGLLLISHDLAQVAQFADRVIVMRRGEIVDRLAGGDLAHAESAYTRALWQARPSAATYGTRLPTFEDDEVRP